MMPSEPDPIIIAIAIAIFILIFWIIAKSVLALYAQVGAIPLLAILLLVAVCFMVDGHYE
jgi:hypothetical protein